MNHFLEFLLRLLAAPSKTKFLKSFLNVLDFIAVRTLNVNSQAQKFVKVAPFYVNLIWWGTNKKLFFLFVSVVGNIMLRWKPPLRHLLHF